VGVIDPGVIDKGNDQQNGIQDGKAVDYANIQVREQHHQNQTDEQNSSADLTGNVGAAEDLAFSKDAKTCDYLKAFLHNEKADEQPQNGIPQSKTDDQRQLGCFVSQGVEDLSQIGDHIKMSGYLSVNGISQAGYRQNPTGDIVVEITCGFCLQVDDHVHRDQDQAEDTKHIGNG